MNDVLWVASLITSKKYQEKRNLLQPVGGGGGEAYNTVDIE